MHIRGVNKNNPSWQTKLSQFAGINNKYAQQLETSASHKAENCVKDSVELSMDGRQLAKEIKNATQEMSGTYQELMDQLEAARAQGDAIAESAKTQTKCLLIAMRIMSGDDVPAGDYRYLAKNNLELYSKAVSMRITKEHPEKHKRLSEDEEPVSKNGAPNAASAEAAHPEIGGIAIEAVSDTSADLKTT